MADYLGSTQRLYDYFAKDWTRPDLTHAECSGIWLKILSTIFCYPNDRPFQIRPQFQPRQSQRTYIHPYSPINNSNAQPIWVLDDDKGTIAIVEVRSTTDPVNWCSIQGQAYTYIKALNKRSRPTIGIIAQGDKFICWEQTPVGNTAGYECTIPRKLFPTRGEPASVVTDSLAVQGHFDDVRKRARNREFSDL